MTGLCILRKLKVFHSFCLYVVLSTFFVVSCSNKKETIVILIPDKATFQEQLAAKEIRRYLYVLTDTLLPVKNITPNHLKNHHSIIISGLKNFMSSGIADILKDIRIDEISGQGYHIRKIQSEGMDQIWIIGGEQNGVLYGAYHLLEKYGIGFYLHDDIIPEGKTFLKFPDLDVLRNPLFNLRGILPFHDFPEGPDWWDLEDYKAIIGQLPKMGFNFIGFHNYPESGFQGAYKAEPLIWIGLEEDILEDGSVRSAYPVQHFNTGDTTWGYMPRKTSDFYFGADKLFDKDFFGTDYIHDLSPWPHSEEENVRLFNESGDFFGSAFDFSKLLGVKICAGTESSLTIPLKLKIKLKEKGLDPEDKEVMKNIYKGIFSRMKKSYPLDYYWLWTPENWTWNKIYQEETDRVKLDIQIAYKALQEVGAPFQLATCGWVLGPPNNRAEFDNILPKEVPFSCINREVGFTPVEPAFNQISERSLWAIPWLEDDPALTSPQLWVGRVRKDAYDAFRYGCDGLMGIHWRTINVDPMASALSKAAWEIGDWSKKPEGDRDMDPKDFYQEWAEIHFGSEKANEIAEIFSALDGGPLFISGINERNTYLYRTSDWKGGPGGIRVERFSKGDIKNKFGFIEELESLQEQLRDSGSKDRLGYWINTFEYARKMAILGNTLYELDSAMISLNTISPNERSLFVNSVILPKRIQANIDWKEMVHQLLKVVNTKGEMGTIANLQQHSMDFLRLLSKYDDQIKTLTKSDIPQIGMPDHIYSGPDRIIVPTRRSVLGKNEDFKLKIIVLSDQDVEEAVLHYRNLGSSRYKTEPFNFILPGRGIILINSSSFSGEDFEYYISVKQSDQKVLKFPSSAPDITRTVIICPE